MNINRPTGHIALPGRDTKVQPRTEAEYHENSRLGALNHIPDGFRKHLVAFVGEFVGTFMFLFFAFGGAQVANTVPDISSTAVLLYISLAFGFSLVVNAWIFFRITGGVFNPAVTFGLCLIGALTWIRGVVIFVAQIVGAIAAAALVGGLFQGPMPVGTHLSHGTSVARGFFIEMFLTAELIFTIFMLAIEKSKATYLAPIGIGLALFIAHLVGVYYTGASLNPARSFGPAAVYGEFPGHHWIYWIGPLLGALLAVVFFRIVKGLEYETVNIGQDFNDKEVEVFNNDEELPRPNKRDRRRGMTSTQSEA
ncbi:MAG: hypothetical protein Q9159_004037 [Coniocarpon cinnabarinum]